MSYTKRRVESDELNSTPLLKRLLHVEEKIKLLEEFVNNMIKEKGIR